MCSSQKPLLLIPKNTKYTLDRWQIPLQIHSCVRLQRKQSILPGHLEKNNKYHEYEVKGHVKENKQERK